jgi:hypothetical protein
MATSVTYNGNSYSVPAYNDTGYAQGAGNISSYLVALATGSLTLAGGAFTLTADANFGGSFGLIALYLKSTTTNIASAGFLRLANTDIIEWRNAANNGNDLLQVDASDRLNYTGGSLLLNTAGGGLIVTTPDGTKTYLINVDNNGNLQLTRQT